MTTQPESSEKRSSNISIRLSDSIRRRLDKEWKPNNARSLSDYARSLIEEALAARDSNAGGKSGGESESEKLDQVLAALARLEDAERQKAPAKASDEVAEKLDQVLRAVDELVSTTSFVLSTPSAERKEVTEELRNLRGAMSLILINVLVQIAGVPEETAKSAVLSTMTPKGQKHPA